MFFFWFSHVLSNNIVYPMLIKKKELISTLSSWYKEKTANNTFLNFYTVLNFIKAIMKIQKKEIKGGTFIFLVFEHLKFKCTCKW